MIGQYSALLHPGQYQTIQKVWGYRDIHTRQKWKIVWPMLRDLPEEGMTVLDAGCGAGRWSFELALRRPNWEITGIDLDETSITQAKQALAPSINNLNFIKSSFSDYEAGNQYDVVLSVASAHYSVSDGVGNGLFGQFANWLKPKGFLLLIGPRAGMESPYVNWLAKPKLWEVFTRDQLTNLCVQNGLIVESIAGQVGRLGAIAKQLDSPSNAKGLAPARYPIICLLSFLDRWFKRRGSGKSVFWLLIARKPPAA